MDKTLKSNKVPLPQNTLYLFLIMVLGIVFGLMAQDFLSFVIASGHLIPKDDIGRDYLIGAITSAILGFSILFWPIPKIHKQDLILVWIIRTILTIGLLIFFESSHPQDSYWAFYDAINGTSHVRGPLYSPGHRMVTLLTGLNQVIPNSYHGLKVVFSMMGMLACYLFYKCSVLLLGRETRKTFYFIALFPSLFFWSSVIDKGTIIILGMSIYAYGTISWHKTKKTTCFIPILSGIVLMSFGRIWMGAIATLPLVLFFLLSDVKFYKKLTCILVSFAILFLLSKSFIERYELFTLDKAFIFLDFKTRAWSPEAYWVESGSGQVPNFQIKTWKDIFSFLPWGIFTALFRPFPWELGSLMGILAGFENIFLLILIFIAFLKTRWKNVKNLIFIWLILLIATWAGFFCFISYQNFGTAIRYKAQILPVILLLIVYLTKAKP